MDCIADLKKNIGIQNNNIYFLDNLCKENVKNSFVQDTEVESETLCNDLNTINIIDYDSSENNFLDRYLNSQYIHPCRWKLGVCGENVTGEGTYCNEIAENMSEVSTNCINSSYCQQASSCGGIKVDSRYSFTKKSNLDLLCNMLIRDLETDELELELEERKDACNNYLNTTIISSGEGVDYFLDRSIDFQSVPLNPCVWDEEEVACTSNFTGYCAGVPTGLCGESEYCEVLGGGGWCHTESQKFAAFLPVELDENGEPLHGCEDEAGRLLNTPLREYPKLGCVWLESADAELECRNWDTCKGVMKVPSPSTSLDLYVAISDFNYYSLNLKDMKECDSSEYSNFIV